MLEHAEQLLPACLWLLVIEPSATLTDAASLSLSCKALCLVARGAKLVAYRLGGPRVDFHVVSDDWPTVLGAMTVLLAGLRRWSHATLRACFLGDFCEFPSASPVLAELLGRCSSVRVLKNMALEDVGALACVPEIDIDTCPSVSDVSRLGRAQHLYIGGTKVSDVSMLGGVRCLSLMGNDRISDVSRLCSVHDLNLAYCSNITDVSMLGAVHRLSIVGCGVTHARSLLLEGDDYIYGHAFGDERYIHIFRSARGLGSLDLDLEVFAASGGFALLRPSWERPLGQPRH